MEVEVEPIERLILVLRSGYLDRRVSAKRRQCKCKMKQFRSLSTPRLFDPLHDLGDEQL